MIKKYIVLLSIFTTALFFFKEPVLAVDTSIPQVYWGAYISGNTYGTNPATGQSYGNTPWDLATWDLFEAHAGKKISILHWGVPWYRATQNGYPGIGDGHFQKFFSGDFEKVRLRGAIPFVDWASYALGAPAPIYNQPTYTLANIINGNFDTYIRQWATDAKNWGHPFFLRFDWEMNGNWYPWSELRNGNSTGQYVAAWRHVHDIFTSVGATNVTWVWCPNISSTDTTTSIPLAGLYPGDAYVDWTCLDGYNKNTTSLSFTQLFRGRDAGIPYLNNSYQIVTSLAPSKPLIIGETASNEYPMPPNTPNPELKSAWITDALLTQIPTNFPKIKAVLWFNWNTTSANTYVIETSPLSQAAFASAISLPYYADNRFVNLPLGPIQPISLPTSSLSAASPTRTIRPGDANNDGKVDELDYRIWILNYGQTVSGGASVGDFNSNNIVDGIDYIVWLVNSSL